MNWAKTRIGRWTEMAQQKQMPAPLDVDDSALDAAVGGGGEGVTEETVIFQFGAIPVSSKTRSGGDPDRPIIVGSVPNSGK